MTTYRPRFFALIIAACAICVPMFSASSAWADDDSNTADPALQQVVNDDEKIDMQSTVVIDAKHVDIAPRFIDGKWTIMARDDTQAPPTWRPLGNIVFKLGDKSIQTLPDGHDFDFTGAHGGDKVYTVPQTEIEGVPWLGWSTQSPAVVKQVNGQVSITFDGHQGPGQFTNFLQEGLGQSAKVLWTSEKKQPQAINVDLNTHTHTNWIFTQAGVHLVHLTICGTLNDGKDVCDSSVVRFAVDGATNPDDAFSATWKSSGPDSSAIAKSDQASDVSNDSSLVWVVGGALLAVGIVAGIGGLVLSRKAKKVREDARHESLNVQAGGN